MNKMALPDPDKPPRGRPPKGYAWRDGGFVQVETLLAFVQEEHDALLREIWRRARIEKYAANLDGRRDRNKAKLAAKRRLRGAKPRRHRLPNSALVRSEGREAKGSTDKIVET